MTLLGGIKTLREVACSLLVLALLLRQKPRERDDVCIDLFLAQWQRFAVNLSHQELLGE